MRHFLLCSLVVLCCVAPASAVTITHDGVTVTMDFVTVGNPGNDADDEVMRDGTTGYGGVNYSYNIGKYEVTENQWDAVSGIAGDLLDDPGYWSGDQPVGEISWDDAAMFCNWLTSGNVTAGAYAVAPSGEVTGIDRDTAVATYGTVYVIPTEDEWYKAAYYDPNKSGGPGYWDYPTGSDARPDGIDFDGDTTFDVVYYDNDNQYHPNDVDNAGVPSPYGTVGQGGNVWEWNETDIFSAYGVRGGDWDDFSTYLHASYRHRRGPSSEDYGRGFRVASIPEPGSVTLLMCGTIGLLAYSWRRQNTR